MTIVDKKKQGEKIKKKERKLPLFFIFFLYFHIFHIGATKILT